MADIVLRDGAGDEQIYYGVDSITLPTADGGTQGFEIEKEKVEAVETLAMAEGDQIIVPEAGKVFTKVTIQKPVELVSENIRSGVTIGGVEGKITTPKLATPTVSVTSGSAYDTLKVENPVSNGAFAAELRCFIDGELVTTKTPPEPGAASDIADVSIFNGKEGPQTMTFCFAADGFERSEYYEHQTDLTEVVITPETVSDGYDYPAIRTGGTYQGIISEKNKTNGYLPPSVSVLKGGADCGYTWDHDVGIDTTFSGNYIATRCRNGSLTVPNVDRKLEVNIPYTELPQLDPVRFSTENGKVVVIPPGYAQTVTVLVDGQVEQTIQGASYTLENMGGDNGFTLTGGSFGVETGSVPQAFCSNAASGIYRLSKIVLNAPEAMSVTLRCVFYSDSPANNYGILSKLDTALTAGTSEATANIYKSFSGLSALTPQYITYDVPAGSHSINMKLRIGTGSAGAVVFGVMPYTLCPSKAVRFSDYLQHTISAIASAPDSLDSTEAAFTYQMKPMCTLENCLLTVSNLVPGVEEIEVLIDGASVHMAPYAGEGDFVLDMRQFTDYSGKHEVFVRTTGTNCNAESNTFSGYVGQVPVYGVSGMYQSDPLLTRTDDAVGMTYTLNSDGTVQSDFDNVFPWTDAKLVTDSKGNMFVQMPEMYFRVGADSSYRITDIAVSAVPGETGNWYKVAPFCVGRYPTNYTGTTTLTSKPDFTPTNSATRTNLRTYARNNGAGYQINDLYHQTVLQFLWWIEWATKNAPSIMTGCVNGSGTTGGNGKIVSGRTDSLATPSGYELTRHQMRWHYIEDFVGGMTVHLDGVYMRGLNTQPYATSDPAYFSESTTGKRLLAYKSPETNYCVMAYGWDANNPFLCLPCENTSTDDCTGYFCTKSYDYSSSYYNLICGTNYYWTEGLSGQSRNGFVLRCCSTSTSYVNYGARLMYHGQLE